jgi:uncharacterized protein (DUF2225 family)
MIRLVCSIAILLGLTGTTVATTWRTVDETCPLCKTKFKAEVAGSGSVLDLGLDFRPGFFSTYPSPWPVAVCPKCKFVLFAREYSKDELEKCAKIVDSAEFKKCSGRSSYFLLATLGEQLKWSDLTLAHHYLGASWQEKGDEEKEDWQLSD